MGEGLVACLAGEGEGLPIAMAAVDVEGFVACPGSEVAAGPGEMDAVGWVEKGDNRRGRFDWKTMDRGCCFITG